MKPLRELYFARTHNKGTIGFITMIQYEELPTIILDPQKTTLFTDILPEVLHMDDPALSAIIDFTQSPLKTINTDDSIDDALSVMKMHDTSLLFVVNHNEQPIGVITSEDILGEGPIKIQQTHNISRSKVLVHMLMEKIKNIPALDFEVVNHFKIGNIVSTLKKYHQHYALVIKQNGDGQVIRGIFTASYITQRLHRPLGL